MVGASYYGATSTDCQSAVEHLSEYTPTSDRVHSRKGSRLAINKRRIAFAMRLLHFISPLRGYFTMIFLPSMIYTPFGSTEDAEKTEFTEIR